MAKITIHCIRHAQGYHNLSTANHSIPDPLLTPLGIGQCEVLSKAFPSQERITHFVSSPLRRTLYTTLLSFPSIFPESSNGSGKKILALPEAQETSDLPCDTGSSIPALESEFNSSQVDFSLLHPDWNSKTGKWSPAAYAIEARAREARIFLRNLGEEAQKNRQEEVNIVLVTHGGFLHYFTQDWDGALGSVGTGWSNTEFRSYNFLDGEDASIKETRESRERRRGTEKELSQDEQRELRAAAEREWGLAGFQTPSGSLTPVEKTVEEEHARL